MKLFKRIRTIKGKKVESRHWYAWLVEHKTGKKVLWNSKCRLKESSEEALRQLRKQNELVAYGLRPSPVLEANMRKPLIEHSKDYLNFLEGKNRAAEYVYNVGNYLRIVIAGCGWRVPGDASLDSYYSWRNAQHKGGKAAKTIREYQATLSAFFHWLKTVGRIPFNLLENVDRVPVDGRKKRVRRVLSIEEFQRFLDVSGKRAMAYYVVANMGLRRGDGDGLTWGDLFLDTPIPYWISRAHIAKVKKQVEVPLLPDVCQALLAIRPSDWKPNDKVFPDKLPSMWWFNKDLKAAGIDRLNAKGEVFDMHALRTTFGTHVSRNMAFAAAKKVIRHTYDNMTADNYFKPSTADLGSDFAKVPALGSMEKWIQKWTKNIGLHGHDASLTVKNDLKPDGNQPIDFQKHSPELSATGTDGPHPQIGCPARIRT